MGPIDEELKKLVERRDDRTFKGFLVGFLIGTLLGKDVSLAFMAGAIIGAIMFWNGEDEIKQFKKDYTIGGDE